MRISIEKLIALLQDAAQKHSEIDIPTDSRFENGELVLDCEFIDGLCSQGKDDEIYEYGVRGNIYFAAVEAEKMIELLDVVPREEIMAFVISISEEFENQFPDGTNEEFIAFAQQRLRAFSKQV